MSAPKPNPSEWVLLDRNDVVQHDDRYLWRGDPDPTPISICDVGRHVGVVIASDRDLRGIVRRVEAGS